jgi:hypothetical protein
VEPLAGRYRGYPSLCEAQKALSGERGLRSHRARSPTPTTVYKAVAPTKTRAALPTTGREAPNCFFRGAWYNYDQSAKKWFAPRLDLSLVVTKLHYG